MRRRGTSTSIRRACAPLGTRGASSGPCPASATTASPAKCSSRSTTRTCAPGPGVSTSTACGATVARSGARSSTFAPRSCRRCQPAPTTPYDIPTWSTPKVARDQLASVAKATYSLPHPYVGQVLTARADTQTVRFYLRGLVIKMHARQPPGGQSIDPQRLSRRTERLRAAQRHGVAAAGRPGRARDRALRGGAPRQPVAVDAHAPRLRAAQPRPAVRPDARDRRSARSRSTPTCSTSIACAACSSTGSPRRRPRRRARALPRARYLRPAHQYALPLRAAPPEGEESQ